MKIAVCVMAIMVMCLCPGRISVEKDLVSVERMRHKAKPSSKKQVEKLETNLEQKIKTVSAKIENEAETSGKKREEIYKSVKGVDTKIINIEDKVDDLKNTSKWQSEKVNHQIEDLKNASNWQSEKINRQIEELTIQMENATQHSVEIYSNIETLETDVKSLAQTIQDNIKDQAQMTQQIMSTLASLTQMMVKHTEVPPMVQGVIITGGHGALTSTELFLPESGKTCSLQSLPANRDRHTMDNLAGHIILCGGANTRTSCLEFLHDSSSGSWAHYATLAQGRYGHTTYISKDSEQLMVMGGGTSQGTTEILGEGAKYSLQQNTYYACSIPEHSSTILTGGYGSGYLSSVVRYDYQGYVENLPDLATARYHHGCGYYEDNGDKVLVVAGGRVSAGDLSTTELLTPGAKAWSSGESLPRTLYAPSSVNMDGFILLIGGYDGANRGEVLKFAGTWTEVGRMKNARREAAATIIDIPREGGILDISTCI